MRACIYMTTLLLALLLLPAAAHAETIRTYLDGRELTFDVAPRLENNRTLAPVRGILTPLGATIGWDEVSRTVTAKLNSTTVELQIDSDQAKVNGQVVALDAPARIFDGRTLVPLRFLAESFGFRVHWDGEARTIAIASRSGTVAGRDGSTRSTGALLAEMARRYVGSPYAWGGTGPTSFDCSGFVWFLSSKFNISLPRTSFDMFGAGTPVSRDALLPGDLVFYTTYAAGASHVGVYLGDGTFVHAASENSGVRITPMDNVWWAPRYLGARRITK